MNATSQNYNNLQKPLKKKSGRDPRPSGDDAPAVEVPTICKEKKIDDSASIQMSLMTIDNLDNILLKTTYPITVCFRITFGKQIIGTSPPIVIQNRFAHTIDYTCQHIISETNVKSLDELCRQPYVISIVCNQVQNNEKSPDKVQARSFSSRSTKSSNKNISQYGVSEDGQTDLDITSNVIYQQTLDPLPILLGDDLNKETIVMKPLTGKSCLMLDLRYPVISVAMRPFNNFSHPALTNLLSISIESLVNFDPLSLTSFSKCKAKVHFVNKDSLDDSLKVLDFPTCVTFESSDISKPLKYQPPAKRWFTLAGLTENSGLSLYRNEGDLLDLKYPGMGDTVPLSYYEDIMKESKLDLKFYQFRRMWLSPELQNDILNGILKNKNWLVELVFEKPMAVKGKFEDEPLHYVAYVDVSNLVYPGVNSTRVLAHLWTYNPTNIENMTGITLKSCEPQARNSTSSKEERKQSTSAKHSSENVSVHSRLSKKYSRVSAFSIVVPEHFSEAAEVFDKDKKPVFLVLQVELFKSLLPRKPPLDKNIIMSQGAPDVKLEVNTEVTLQKNAWNSFREGIRYVAEIVQKEYQCYKKLVSQTPISRKEPRDADILRAMYQKTYMINDLGSSAFVKPNIDDKDFYEWLLHKLDYGRIQDILKVTINNYITNFLSLPSIDTASDILNFQENLYTRLVGDVQFVLNNIIDLSENVQKEDLCFNTSEEILINAVEWSDRGDYDQAQSLLLKRIYYYGELDADLWIDLAVICLHHGRVSECKDALCHALSMSPKSRDALIMYATIMHSEGEYNTAEFFFDSLTQFYPRFYQGWIILNIYYSVTDNHQGRDITLAMAGKCLADLPQPDPPMTFRKNSNSWTQALVSNGDVYIQTATYLLSLGLYEYAENCLSVRVARIGDRPLEHYYYLAAAYHCQKKFKECECTLEAAFRDFQSYNLYTLRGHNYYLMGDKRQARAMYKFAIQHPDAPDDNFLCLFRYAEDSYENNDFVTAENIFTKLSFILPSALSWNYLGKIQYHYENYAQSESSFAVANHIDPTFSEPWAYLGMIAVFKKKFELAEKCFSEAKKNGLDNEDIIQKLECIFNENSANFLHMKECAR